MRPILLNGHGRSMTLIKYNADGDILFTISKDKAAAAWWSDTGERIGTYEGHNGAVWDLDVSADSTMLVTGSGDSSAIIWNTQTGAALTQLHHDGPVHCVALSEGGKMLITVSKELTGGMYQLRLYEIDASLQALSPLEEGQTLDPVQTLRVPSSVCGVWMPLNRGVMIGTENGALLIFRFLDGRIVDDEDAVHIVDAHKGKINSIEFNKKKTLFITASKDCSAKVFDSSELVCRKIFATPAPINHAAISPLFDHVMTGGGQDAKDVTTTSARQGKFMVRFFHTIYQEEFGRVKGHFGPVNSVAFHPSGRGFASGGEDGYVRIHTFDAGYFKVTADMDRDIDKAVSMLTNA